MRYPFTVEVMKESILELLASVITFKQFIYSLAFMLTRLVDGEDDACRQHPHENRWDADGRACNHGTHRGAGQQPRWGDDGC